MAAMDSAAASMYLMGDSFVLWFPAADLRA